MAAGDSAVAFLETSLGTHIVVSFPAHITTVADLKRQVAAQHSASFPMIGPIAVTSLQIKIDDIWYVLADPVPVQDAFVAIEAKGPWHLRVEAHPLPFHPSAEEDMSPPAAPQEGPVNLSCAAAAILGTPHKTVDHVSGRCEDGTSVTQQNLDLGVPACIIDRPPWNQQDKPQEDVDDVCTSTQRKDGSTMLQQSTDLAIRSDKDSGMLGRYQNVIIAEKIVKKRFREEGSIDESIVVNLNNGNLTSLASSRNNVKLTDVKSYRAGTVILNNDPSSYILGRHRSHVLGQSFSYVQIEPWILSMFRGEGGNNMSNIRFCIKSMEGNNSSDKELNAYISEAEEPQIAGSLCTTESQCKETYILHCVESMKEDNRRSTSSNIYSDIGENEEAALIVLAEHEACFPRRQCWIALRKVPLSQAKKKYAFRDGSSADANQVCSIKSNNKGAHKLNRQNNSEENIKSRLRAGCKEVHVMERAVSRKIEHNLEVSGVVNRGRGGRFAQQDGVEEARKSSKKKRKMKGIGSL